MGQRCPDCVREEGVQRVIPTVTRRRSPTGDAPATRTFIALAVIFYALSRLGVAGDTILANLAQVNAAVAAGEWWRIFTVVLLHGSITHILFNMWALWVLGPQIERGVGTMPFVALYLASAGVGGVASFFGGDLFDIGVGASGAIFGLFGIWLNWAIRRRNTLQGRAVLSQLGFLLLINAAIPFLIPNIAWQAHVGGLVGGFVIGELWSRVGGVETERTRTLIAVAVAALAALSVIVF